LECIPQLVDVKSGIIHPSSSAEAVQLVLASLAVIGGYTERLRVGGRVVKTSVDAQIDEYGLLVDYDRVSGYSKVLFDADTNQVIEFQPEKLNPVIEFPVDPSSFPLTPNILSFFVSLVCTPEILKKGETTTTLEEKGKNKMKKNHHHRKLPKRKKNHHWKYPKRKKNQHRKSPKRSYQNNLKYWKTSGPVRPVPSITQ